MLPWESELAGRLERHTITSHRLRGNPLGDPYERPLLVYTPPGYAAAGGDRRYPAVYVIQGFSGMATTWTNRSAFRRSYPEAIDAVFASGQVPECLVVFVDAWTGYGGSQFVDSPGTGAYHSYLCDEVVPWVDANYRTIAAPESRAITGKSSGGFGAMITPMLRPDLFGALATHAGDSLYEYCYLKDFGRAARHLRAYDHDIFQWWRDFQSRAAEGRAFTKEADAVLLIVLAGSACFSAAEDGTPLLPFDARTGEVIPDRWQRWLDWDPVRMVDRYADALRSLRAIWIDAGTRDEFFLDLGAEAFRNGLARIGVPEDRIHFELFDAGHSDIQYRYPLALAWLAGRLAR